MILFFVVILTLFGCTEHTLYLTPEVHGYIYSSKTKKPIADVNFDMGFNGLTDNNAAKIKTSKDGGFIIPAVQKTYYYFKPNLRKYSAPPEIYISADKYQPKVTDYSLFYGKQVSENTAGYSYLNKIDIGIIYLEPEK